MFELLMVLVLLAVVVGLAIAIILLLANLGAYFTKIAKGVTIFINRGDDLHAILPNIDGFMMSKGKDLDGQPWLIPGTDEERMEAFFSKSLPGTIWLQKILWKMFGVRFISFVWPHTYVHKFDIRSRKRIKERTAVEKDAPIRSRVVDSPEPTTTVDSLLFLVPRPVFLEGVELAGDNSRINLLLLPIYRQVIPSLPVYNLKGEFFTPLDAAIEAAMVDFFASHRVAVYKNTQENKAAGRSGQFATDSYDPPQSTVDKQKYEELYEPAPLTYSLWLKLTKAREGSPLQQRLHPLNVNKAYRDRLRAKKESERLADYIDELTHREMVEEMPSEELKKIIPSGIVPRFGFAMMSFRVVEWEAHESTKALAEALLAKETELHTAEGVRQKAYGVRDATLAQAEGESSRYERLVNALVSKGVDANVAAQVVLTQLRTENIRDSKVTTYVEGGASASIMVPASSSTSTVQ